MGLINFYCKVPRSVGTTACLKFPIDFQASTASLHKLILSLRLSFPEANPELTFFR
jgi:hypothetical protein